MKPRLRHNALNLHRLLGCCGQNQLIATLHHLAVLALLEINLQDVKRHQVVILLALIQRVETLARRLILATRVGDVGVVICSVLGILALGLNAVEILLRLRIVALHKGEVTHSQVISLTLLWRERLVIHLQQLLLRKCRIGSHRWTCRICELHLVLINRASVLRDESLQATLCILHLEFVVTQREIVINLLPHQTVGHWREFLLHSQQLGARLDAVTEVIERNCPFDALLHNGCLRLRHASKCHHQQRYDY